MEQKPAVTPGWKILALLVGVPVALVVLVGAGLVVLGAVIVAVDPDAGKRASAPVAAPTEVQSKALDAMVRAFEGNHSRAEIKARMDLAMTLYKLPITEENYSRAGSALAGLQKDFDVDEMVILDHMIRSHVPGVTTFTFPEAAALSVTFIKAGDK